MNTSSSLRKHIASENVKTNQAFLIYQDDNGITQVNVRFEGEDVWLPIDLIMELFDASHQDVSYHIDQIYASGELSKDRTHKKLLLVRQEGNRSVNRQIRDHVQKHVSGGPGPPCSASPYHFFPKLKLHAVAPEWPVGGGVFSHRSAKVGKPHHTAPEVFLRGVSAV